MEQGYLSTDPNAGVPIRPEATHAPSGGSVMRRIQDDWDARTKTMSDNAPMIAGLAAAPFTAGMSAIPATAAIGAASATGSLMRGDDAESVAWNGLTGAASEFGARALGGVAGAKKLANGLWRRVTGTSNPDATAAILDRGRGALTGANNSALRAEAVAGSRPATEASTVLDASGRPFQGATEAAKSPLWPAFFTHRDAMKSSGGPAARAVRSIPIVGGALAEAVPSLGARGAQLLHSGMGSGLATKVSPLAAKYGADPARAAILALLSGHDDDSIRPMASH